MTGQTSWPPPCTELAACGQFFMAANMGVRTAQSVMKRLIGSRVKNAPPLFGPYLGGRGAVDCGEGAPTLLSRIEELQDGGNDQIG